MKKKGGMNKQDKKFPTRVSRHLKLCDIPMKTKLLAAASLAGLVLVAPTMGISGPHHPYHCYGPPHHRHYNPPPRHRHPPRHYYGGYYGVDPFFWGVTGVVLGSMLTAAAVAPAAPPPPPPAPVAVYWPAVSGGTPNCPDRYYLMQRNVQLSNYQWGVEYACFPY